MSSIAESAAVAPEGDSALAELARHLELTTEHGRLLSQLVAQHEGQLADLRRTVGRLGAGDLVAKYGNGNAHSASRFLWCRTADEVLTEEKRNSEEILEMPRSQPYVETDASVDANAVKVDAEKQKPSEACLRPAWSKTDKPARSRMVNRAQTIGDTVPSYSNKPSDSPKNKSPRVGQTRHMKACKRCMTNFIMRPTGHARGLWDILSLVAISHDILTLPMVVFDMVESEGQRMFVIGTSVFWTLDLFAGFLVGYEKEGRVIMDPWSVAINNLRTWFIPDIVMVGTDWFVFIFVEGSGPTYNDALRAGKAFRIVRVLRMIRMVRIARLSHIVGKLALIFDIEMAKICLGIVKLLGVVGIFAHFLACSWYGWAASWKEYYVDRTWLNYIPEDEGVTFRYLLSLQWILAQVTPCPTPYFPQNSPELLFAIMLMFFCFWVFTSFLGTVAARLTIAKQRAFEITTRDMRLRRFFIENPVSQALQQRIKFLVQKRQAESDRILFDDVVVFKLLPKRYQMQLRYEVCCAVYQKSWNYCFFCLDRLHHSVVVHVCYEATSEKLFGKLDEIYYAGSIAEEMLIVMEGRLLYSDSAHLHIDATRSISSVVSTAFSSEGSTAKVTASQTFGSADLGEHLGEATLVIPDECLCEGALWMDWLHGGGLIGKTGGVYMITNAKKFGQIVAESKDADVFFAVQRYAKKYVELVLNEGEFTPSDLGSDVFEDLYSVANESFPSVDLDELPRRSRRQLASRGPQTPIERLRNNRNWFSRRP